MRASSGPGKGGRERRLIAPAKQPHNSSHREPAKRGRRFDYAGAPIALEQIWDTPMGGGRLATRTRPESQHGPDPSRRPPPPLRTQRAQLLQTQPGPRRHLPQLHLRRARVQLGRRMATTSSRKYWPRVPRRRALIRGSPGAAGQERPRRPRRHDLHQTCPRRSPTSLARRAAPARLPRRCFGLEHSSDRSARCRRKQEEVGERKQTRFVIGRCRGNDRSGQRGRLATPSHGALVAGRVEAHVDDAEAGRGAGAALRSVLSHPARVDEHGEAVHRRRHSGAARTKAVRVDVPGERSVGVRRYFAARENGQHVGCAGEPEWAGAVLERGGELRPRRAEVFLEPEDQPRVDRSGTRGRDEPFERRERCPASPSPGGTCRRSINSVSRSFDKARRHAEYTGRSDGGRLRQACRCRRLGLRHCPRFPADRWSCPTSNRGFPACPGRACRCTACAR